MSLLSFVIICALPLEYNAVSLLYQYGHATSDTNLYTTRQIGKHNVLFPGLKFAFFAGVCGGTPKYPEIGDEILLGGVVISKTAVGYDFGRQNPGSFVCKDTLDDNLGRPNRDICSLLASYLHKHHGLSPYVCEDCNRFPHSIFKMAHDTIIRLGRIASGDIVMKSEEHRETLVQNEKVISFQMESAGIWDEGVSDYADSHKNNQWQDFAVLMSASTIKALLERYIGTKRRR
ncbi:nucleoside phosphorylase domain-containing protein [Talaromyces proteolyticus]|uniref:Nucleoside phosphorylase domain-containing protein n=1 Tax=Talaromyces proteolyticus TaxID=1131652 RepID=A0AAD4PVI8_9EURO|nr:nucleoside phosphorylase domain-containing protein [Talaromyces proteolyticus]KAH8690743.1 nucleoside phosphorylase domain-containing protein [Talaromyces proteolyticus]